MTDLKLTTWNIEHFGRVLARATPESARRKRAIAEEVREIDPDVLCIVEGPGDLPALRAWVDDPADGLAGAYRVPVIPGTDALLDARPASPRAALADLYAMQGTDVTGNQWVWFLVRAGLAEAATELELQDPVVWQELVGGETWRVHFWGDMTTRRHRHWRHPQVLVLELEGRRAELVGVHLKSKLNRARPFDESGVLRRDYVDRATKARIKLATEAANLRDYIDARFEQEPDPAIFLLGDANDGPGRRFFERQYLFFDLLSNVQGDVFFARRFLNHALFDFDDALRYSTEFDDPLDRDVDHQLLDHILFTQALVGEGFPKVESHAGLVEHRIHEAVNAALVGPDTSDHRPVSVTVRWSPA